jgi:hypothetical protein
MRKTRKRPVLRIRAHFNGTRPFMDAYADVLALLLRPRQKAKSSIRTFDSGETFHYDSDKNKKESDHDGTND